MKNKKKKLKVKRLLVALFVMLVIAVAILVMSIKVKEIEDVSYNGEEEARFAKEYLEDKLIPQGISTFTQNYKGEIDKETFYTKLDVVQKYLTDLSIILEEKDAEKFYQTNSVQIKKYLGIEKQDEFVKVAEIVKEEDIKDATFEYCKIDKNSYSYENGYIQFNISFCYDNGTEMVLEIGIAKIYNKQKPILIVSAP